MVPDLAQAYGSSGSNRFRPIFRALIKKSLEWNEEKLKMVKMSADEGFRLYIYEILYKDMGYQMYALVQNCVNSL